MAGIAWVNGRILDAEDPAVTVTDRGFMYGEGLFETMRAYGGRVFRLGQHCDRLVRGAGEIGLTVQAHPVTPEVFQQAVAEALSASDLPEAVVRVTLTSRLLVALVRPLSLPLPEQYERGCVAITVPAAVMPTSPLRRIKSLNYLDKLLAQRDAEAAGAHEAILVDPDGYVVEAARRNVFAVIRGRAVTPPVARGLLPGVTRAAVVEVAPRVGIGCEERDIAREELLAAEECFLTSSVAEILPVASVDGVPLRAPGPVTAALSSAYRARVAEELNLSG